jgi:hypothetical protein
MFECYGHTNLPLIQHLTMDPDFQSVISDRFKLIMVIK